MEGNVVNNLCSLPATDLNFTSELNRATAYQIQQAIETMQHNGGKNKGRIKACERELENRRLTKKDKHGKYVSKEHLSILCNTFSSEHRLKAILNKLGECEDAERQGGLIKLPCKDVYFIVDINNPKYAMVMKRPIRELTIYEIENIDKSGCKYFSTEEKAEAKLKELRGEENESSN